MKKLILVSGLWWALGGWARAQWVSIPDTSFGNWLNSNGYSQCLQGSNATGWEMDTTCGTVVSAKVIDCQNKGIGNLSGIEFFDSLETLSCSGNKIDSLTLLPPRVRFLSCRNNYSLSRINLLPDSLVYFDCAYNKILQLPNLPNGLRFLDCSKNRLTTLPTLPPVLDSLLCDNNKITSLPTFPPNLTLIICGGNKNSSIPTLPTGVKYFDCSFSSLDSLPYLPNGLLYLYCAAAGLKNLPTLPDSLSVLNCSSNYSYLTSLPPLPANLRLLDCYNNFINALPELPDKLESLYCHYNKLTALPELNNSLSVLYCHYNVGIRCLPELKNVTTLQFDHTAVTCVPPHAFIQYSTPNISFFPVCDTMNVNPCDSTYSNINPLLSHTFTLTPNPASSYLTISISEEHTGSTFALTDLTGRVVFKSEIENPQSEISIATLPSGIYLATLTTPTGQRAVKKLVKE